jgi:hypothetical protein
MMDEGRLRRTAAAALEGIGSAVETRAVGVPLLETCWQVPNQFQLHSKSRWACLEICPVRR